ncbi:pilus assembly protein, partial [Streptomyces sp. PRKS01-29]|nr:pilus assembly protein [Streptomyces sabulosicollis]
MPEGAFGRSGRRRGAARPRRGDAGSASIEFLGFLPVLILVALAAVQLGIAAYAAQQAGTAARAAARTASLDEPRTSPQAASTISASGRTPRNSTVTWPRSPPRLRRKPLVGGGAISFS